MRPLSDWVRMHWCPGNGTAGCHDPIHAKRRHVRATRGLKGRSDDEVSAFLATPSAEQAALGRLLANWRTPVEQPIGLFFGCRREAL